MKMNLGTTLLVSVAMLALATGSVFAQGAGKKDEKRRQPFDERIPRAEYAQAVAKLERARIDVPTLKRSRFPAVATVIVSVKDGGYADGLGIKKDWVITRFEGVPSWDHRDDWHRDKAGRVLEMLTPEGVAKKFSLPAGLIGIERSNYRRPELAYVRQKENRNPRWDEHVIVALVAWESGDRKLAETAWFHAMKAGMPGNPLAAFYAARVAADRRELTSAAKFTNYVETKFPAGKRLPKAFLEGLQGVALATTDLVLLERIAKESGGLLGPKPETLARWRKWGAPKPSDKTLFARADANHGDNLLKGAKLLDPKGIFTGNVHKQMRFHDRYTSYGVPNTFEASYFGPTKRFRDGSYKMEVAIAAPEGKAHWPPMLTVALIDRENKTRVPVEGGYPPPGRAVAQLNLRRIGDGLYTADVNGGPSEKTLPTGIVFEALKDAEAEEIIAKMKRTKKSVRIPNSKKFYIRLTRIENEVEILINGRVVMHVPADPQIGDLSVFVRMTGIHFFMPHSSMRPFLGDE